MPTSKRPEIVARSIRQDVDTLAALAGHDARMTELTEFVDLARDGEGRFFSIDYVPGPGKHPWQVAVYLGASWTHPDAAVRGVDDHWLERSGVTMQHAVERIAETLPLVAPKPERLHAVPTS